MILWFMVLFSRPLRQWRMICHWLEIQRQSKKDFNKCGKDSQWYISGNDLTRFGIKLLFTQNQTDQQGGLIGQIPISMG